ncbi:MAG: oligosaccharide flippase family protein [Alcanivoracaceae bacterium]|nr:oligosaccharide flippase family protein [Alcanivoracaceae bacterium]
MKRASALRNTAHATLATWTEFFLGMLVSITIARSLAPDTYGHFSFMMWCAAVFVVFGNGGLTTAIIKFMAEAGLDERGATYRYLARLQLGALAAACAIVLVGAQLQPAFFTATADTSLWLALLAASALKASYIFRMSASKGLEDFNAIFKVVLVVAPANLAAALLVALWQPSLQNFVLVYLLTCALYLVMMQLVQRHQRPVAPLSPQLRQRIWRHLWITSVSIILSFLVLKQSEVFFLRLYASAEDIGFFNIAFTLGFALSALFPGVYSALLLPMMSRQSAGAHGQRAQTLHTSVRYLQLLAWPMVLATQVLGGALVAVLYGSAYESAALALMWVIAGVGIAAVGQAGVSQLVSSDRQNVVLRINVLVAIAVLAMDWWAIRHWQLSGAAVAFAVGNAVHATLMLRLALLSCATRWQWMPTFRTLLAASVPALVTWPLVIGLDRVGGPLLSLLLGALCYTLLFIPTTLLCGCWTAGEIDQLHALAGRLPAPLRAPVRMLLAVRR